MCLQCENNGLVIQSLPCQQSLISQILDTYMAIHMVIIYSTVKDFFYNNLCSIVQYSQMMHNTQIYILDISQINCCKI